MNEKLLTSYFRRYLKNNKIKYFEQVPFKYKKIDLVIFKDQELISIELKVSDWKSALHQAGQNLFFSNKSYIGLWYIYKDRLDLDLLNRFNIGLFIIQKNKISEILKPQANNKYLNLDYYKSLKEKMINIYNEVLLRN